MLKHRWSILALLLFTRGTMGFQFQSIAAFAPLIGRDLGLTPAQTGSLIGLYMLPGVVLALPAALVGRWLGAKRAALLALALMAAGGFGLAASAGFTGSSGITANSGFTASSGFAVAALARLAGGAGMVLLNVLLTKTVADRFAGRESATAMALLLAVWPAGIALALATLGGLASTAGWPLAAAVTGAWPLAALLGMAVLYPGAGRPAPARAMQTDAAQTDAVQPGAAPPGAATQRQPMLARSLLLGSAAGWAWTLYNCGFIALVSFLPALLLSRGAGLGEAGLISSFVTWGLMLGTPAGGALADGSGKPRAVVLFACVAGAALIGLAGLGNSPLHFLALGFCIGLPAGPIMAMLGQALPERERGLGYGVLLSWYYAGLAVTPALGGLVLQATGTPVSILALSAALVLATFPVYQGFHWLRGRLEAAA